VNASEKQKGTGLGLAITKTLVEALEGKIQVESELGKGSQFRVYLPFKLNLRTSPKTIGKSIETSVFKDNKKYNLLLVDNSEINQLLVVKSLLNHGGFYVDVAQDGEKALQYIQVRDYDIILMDLKMPNLDGFETTKAIRSLKDRDLKKIPIVALTAFASQDQKKACLKAGMNAYISKPFKQEELISVVEKIFLKANNK
jgi:CheY-like chemotaxis protein